MNYILNIFIFALKEKHGLFNTFYYFTPLGSEALLIYDIKEGYNLYLLLLFATIGNSLGSVINYFLGLKGEEYFLKKSLLKEEYIIKSKNYFDKYGAFSILFSCTSSLKVKPVFFLISLHIL